MRFAERPLIRGCGISTNVAPMRAVPSRRDKLRSSQENLVQGNACKESARRADHMPKGRDDHRRVKLWRHA
jgi:hypothetical protein